MIHYVTGDLLRSDETMIAHGCNCVGVMGAGIAAQIAREMPEVKEAYVAGAPYALGDVHVVWDSSSGKTVFNLMTQYLPGPHAELIAVRAAFWGMCELLHGRDPDHLLPYRVGIPRIGCGIGALKWDEVEIAIENGILSSSRPDLTVVVYDLLTTAS